MGRSLVRAYSQHAFDPHMGVRQGREGAQPATKLTAVPAKAGQLMPLRFGQRLGSPIIQDLLSNRCAAHTDMPMSASSLLPTILPLISRGFSPWK